MIAIYILLALALAYLALLGFCRYTKLRLGEKYAEFAKKHSYAIEQLNNINREYDFLAVMVGHLKEKYDNEHNYESISPKDYLTYQLVYKKSDVLGEMKSAESNKRLYSVYEKRVKNIPLGRFDSVEMTSDVEKLENILKKLSLVMIKKPEISREISLCKAEKQAFESLIKRPVTDYFIEVKLYQVYQNGDVAKRKADVFYSEEIREIITALGHKRGDYYLDDGIWQAICRVERGRVSNRMRFSIYKRDNNRCRKCGRLGVFKDLEIDHIFPISKGGKSEFDNLQTLCHRCNSLKSNTVERGAQLPKYMQKGDLSGALCPECGAPLRLVHGRYGKFYGCTNYPSCKFTKQQ